MDTNKKVYRLGESEWDDKLFNGKVKIYEVPKEFRNRGTYIYAARCLRDGKHDTDTYTEKRLLEHMLFCDIIDAKNEGNINRYEDLKDIHIGYFRGNGIALYGKVEFLTTEQESPAKSTNEKMGYAEKHYCIDCEQWEEQPNCVGEKQGICEFLSEGGCSFNTIPKSVVHTSECFGCNYWRLKNIGRGKHYPSLKSQKNEGRKRI